MVQEIDVGMKCIKYMLFVSNFMFVMIGFLLISIGSTIKAIYGDFELFMEVHYFSPAILVVAIGVIIFFVALFGCVGALKESTCLINLYAVFLVCVLIMEIGAAIAAYSMRNELDDTIYHKMEASIGQYNQSEYDRDIWDFTQSRLYCCGIQEPNDWSRIYHTTKPVPLDDDNLTTTGLPQPTFWNGPPSCCRYIEENETTCDSDNIHREGCLSALADIVSESALLLGCGALAVAFIQLLGVIFACMLASAVRRLKTQNLVDREQNRQKVYEQLARGIDDKKTPVLYTPTFSEA